MTNQPRSTLVVPAITAAGALVVLAAAAILVASGGTPAGAIKPSSPPVALASRVPTDSSPDPALEPSAVPPTATPKPTPKPTPTPPPVWSKPTTIRALDGCSSVVAAIDDLGTDHVAATCDGATGSLIRYAVWSDGRTWKTSTFTPPSGRFELDPQLAFAGNTLYVAYTRVAPTDGGCGDDGLTDVGVYYRTRTLPTGAWSEPTRLGSVADHLQSLRVNGPVIHATVSNEKDGKTYYETLNGTSLARQVLGAGDWTSLRVGDDGRGRMAYATRNGITIGTADGAHIASQLIPDSKLGSNPTLVLAPGNDAYVLWTRNLALIDGGGCVSGDDSDPSNGTYFSTDASGTWVTTKLTSLLGGTSMALDPATGEIHALVNDFRRIVYFHRPGAAGSAWAHETLVRGSFSWAVIREDAASGHLLAVFVTDPASESDVLHVQVMTRQ